MYQEDTQPPLCALVGLGDLHVGIVLASSSAAQTLMPRLPTADPRCVTAGSVRPGPVVFAREAVTPVPADDNRGALGDVTLSPAC
ncbi:hypothetical protein ABTX60_24840 [Streptomyces sp. NPDC126510]|uniref:hypothetical protein n=1 Tax=Streptomyces sp. NPDC126510 TaxID=3155317 RepID=UPI00331A2DD7